jgi:peptidoglycan/LPS O-acetylase OafA/YrhL
LVFAASGSVRFIAYETIFGRLDQFIIGMLLAHQWLKRNHHPTHPPAEPIPGISPLWLLLAGVAVLLGLHAFSLKVGFSELASPFWIVWPGLEAALWAAFVWAYLLARWPGPLALRQPIDRALAALGAISFSIYVFHNLVIAAYNARLPPLATGLGPGFDAVATAALVILPAVLAISVITYHLIERPFLAMRSRYLRAPGA